MSSFFITVICKKSNDKEILKSYLLSKNFFTTIRNRHDENVYKLPENVFRYEHDVFNAGEVLEVVKDIADNLNIECGLLSLEAIAPLCWKNLDKL